MKQLKKISAKILLVDEEPRIGETIKAMVEGEEIEFYHCQDPNRVLEAIEEFEPSVLLLDLGDISLLHTLRSDPMTEDLAIVVLSSKEEVKGEVFANGASDFMVKLPGKEELVARLRYHTSLQQLKESEAALQHELHEAAKYVISILPAKENGKIATDWMYIPSFRLGGDIFDYYYVDDDHFFFYFLDVCGHGVGTALLSIQLRNILRMPDYFHVSLLRPDLLLEELNDRYQMEEHHDLYFTIWAGVYQLSTQTLTYSCGGHPSPLLFQKGGKTIPLSSKGLVVGGMPDQKFPARTISISQGDKILLFSDGTYEFPDQNGNPLGYSDYLAFLEKVRGEPSAILERAKSLVGPPPFEDDFSLLQVEFKVDSV